MIKVVAHDVGRGSPAHQFFVDHLPVPEFSAMLEYLRRSGIRGDEWRLDSTPLSRSSGQLTGLGIAWDFGGEMHERCNGAPITGMSCCEQRGM